MADPQDDRAALIERIRDRVWETIVPDPSARTSSPFEGEIFTAVAGAVLSLLDNEGLLCGPWEIRDLTREIDALKAEVKRLHRAAATMAHEVEQTLGRALRYPAYGPDMFPDGVLNGDVCVGDHVPESLADEAADLIERQRGLLRDIAVAARGDADGVAYVDRDHDSLPSEIERLREAVDDWPCPNPDDPEGCYCPGDGPCLADPRTGE